MKLKTVAEMFVPMDVSDFNIPDNNLCFFSFQNSFGFGLEHFTIKIQENSTHKNEDSRMIISRLKEDFDTISSDWVLKRRPCLNCLYFRICGARFATGDGNPCARELLPIVDHVQKAGHKLRSILLSQ